MKLTTVPFSGYYESLHSQALETALEQMHQDDQGNPTPDYEKAQESLNWRQARIEYAKVYTQDLADLAGISIEFESLQSPREYNFETDQIFANITEEDIQKLYTETRDLRTLARERFTSRDGFASFYSPDIDTWPKDPTTWDHNHLGCLLQAYLDQEHPSHESGRFCQWAELEVVEHARCNGVLENIVWNALPPELK
jgi:hypothetical protein